jgi:ketosteroid isomerase-like protein
VNATVARLLEAMNQHDLELFVAQFAPDYRSQQPVHPGRGFGGRDQVRKNWSAIFAGVPDFSAELVAEATDGDTCWSEWAWHGHHADGSALEMRGVIVMELTADGLIREGRLYVEPVEQQTETIDEAVRKMAKPSQ